MTLNKGLFIGVLSVVVILIALVLWSISTTMISAKDDLTVVCGFALLIATTVGVVLSGAKLIHYALQKPKNSKKDNDGGTMKKLVVLFLLLAALPILAGACTRVDPGYVGIKVNLYGSDKGVEDLPLVTGRVWYNPWSTDIYVFPTFMQTVTWTQSKTEESPDDDSITFNSVEGAVLNTDISIAYTFEATKVPNIFKEFRQPAKVITWKYMRSQIRDAFSRHASNMKAVDIFGARKQELLIAVKKDLNDNLGPKGFHFDMVSLVGAIRADENVKRSINAVIEAAQKAIEAENKVRESTAIANQKIEAARGEGESVLVVAKKQAEANDVLTKSITPTLIQWETLKKWNGVLPQVTSGAVPFVTVPSGK